MTTFILIDDTQNLVKVKRETEKAFLFEATDKGNRPCWFPKSGFEVTRRWDGKPQEDIIRADGATIRHLSVKDWLWKKLDPSQEALLNWSKIA